MRSFSSRYCLIVPLVSALMVTSQTFIVKSTSVEKKHFIQTNNAAPGNNVKVVLDDCDAGTVFIDPMPEGVGSVVNASIMDTHSSLYVGLRDIATPGTHLEWSYTAFNWQIEKTSHDKYVIYHQAPHSRLSWHDGNTVDHRSRTIGLEADVETRIEWCIHPEVVEA